MSAFDALIKLPDKLAITGLAGCLVLASGFNISNTNDIFEPDSDAYRLFGKAPANASRRVRVLLATIQVAIPISVCPISCSWGSSSPSTFLRGDTLVREFGTTYRSMMG
ncbi:hypothetical protein EDD18DRAFT_378845 [Armillaria luteobubalina]|uniref:Uncharacterized protein n=1 Tax=Armillaria luteobubalina TaxID=153913 RepID=A0AA39Q1F2_9AGAR|nr:hypothetical protein EDD18DRAFT_378845 [Armillaria luteobubalina]